MANLSIPLPPLDEQRRIAAILDQADAIRSKRAVLAGRIADLAPSMFSARFSSGHDLVSIGSLADVKGGKRLPKGEPYADDVTAHPYIRVSDLRVGRIVESELVHITPDVHQKISRYVVSEGDVVISIAGTIGVSAPVPSALDGANLTENAARITPKMDRPSFNAIWLSWALQSPAAQSQVRQRTGQVTIGKLALFRIEQINVPRVPREAQDEFARAVMAAQSLLERNFGAASQDDALFASLQSRAFRGDL